MKKLYVVGLGAGARENRTLQCQQVLAECDVIAGYTVYVEQVRDEYPDKEYLVTGMMKETERCRMAIEKSAGGKNGGYGLQRRQRCLRYGRFDL